MYSQYDNNMIAQSAFIILAIQFDHRSTCTTESTIAGHSSAQSRDTEPQWSLESLDEALQVDYN